MDFEYSEQEKDLLSWGKELGKLLQKEDRDPESFQKELWIMMAKKNFFETIAPTGLNGLGLTAFEVTLVLEGIASYWRNTGMLFSACAQLFACMVPIIRFGTKEQKEIILSKLFTGEIIIANLMTEPESGSDCFNIMTRTVSQTKDTYVISGNKCFGTNAPIANYFLTYIKTKPELGYLGISCILIDKNIKGISISKPYEKMGLKGSQLGDVCFDECVVDKSQIIGKEGMGGAIFNYSMTWERTCLYAIYLGMMEKQLEDVISFVKIRTRFGKKLSSFQAVQNIIVGMKQNIEISRLLLYRATHYLDKENGNAIYSSLSKLFLSQAAVDNSSAAIQLYGAYGYTKEAGIEQMLRDSIPAKIFSGTSEIQKQIIAREMGL